MLHIDTWTHSNILINSGSKQAVHRPRQQAASMPQHKHCHVRPHCMHAVKASRTSSETASPAAGLSNGGHRNNGQHKQRLMHIKHRQELSSKAQLSGTKICKAQPAGDSEKAGLIIHKYARPSLWSLQGTT